MLLFPSSTSQTPESVLASLPATASPTSPHFLLFWGSVDPTTGASWCSDSRNAEPLVTKYIPENKSSLVYVGQRDEWKSADNPFRKAFGLTAIPTIIKVERSGQSNLKGQQKLVEKDIMDEEKLKEFVGLP